MKAFPLRPGMIAFGDPRPRNNEGEFSPISEDVPSPHAMAAAYGTNRAGGPGSIAQSLGRGVAAGVGAVIGIGGTKLARKMLLSKLKTAI